jgi:hypothetical protein
MAFSAKSGIAHMSFGYRHNATAVGRVEAFNAIDVFAARGFIHRTRPSCKASRRVALRSITHGMADALQWPEQTCCSIHHRTRHAQSGEPQ